MNVMEILDHEHQLIAPALQVAQAYARRLALPGAVADPVGFELVGFLDKFVSQCHQTKEFVLFVSLLRKGHASVTSPVAGLHAEHSRLAQLTEALAVAWQMLVDGQMGSGELVAGYLADYAALLQEHLLKEERFYKVTHAVLAAEDHSELKAVFEKVEQETLGADGYSRYSRWASELAGARF